MADENLLIKRVASDFISAINTDTWTIKDKSPLAVYFMKAFEVFTGDGLFAPIQMLGESGILAGAAKAIYNFQSVPMTTDFDPHDWSYENFQEFGTREITLDLTGSFSVKRFLSQRDLQRQYQSFKEGNYATVADYFQGLVKQIAFSVAVKRNVLIMEALYKQGQLNGIEEINIEYPKDMSQVTAFGAREAYFDKLFDIYADFQKFIKYAQGVVGTKTNDYLCLISINKIYKLRRAIVLVGSEQAYSDLVQGNVVIIQGLRFQSTPYLDNKFYIHEKLKEKGEDGRDIYEPVETNFKDIDCILFHKLVFPFKFGVPTFLAAQIPAHPISLFHHIENYSTWEDICRKDPKGQDAKILPQFLKAFKFNITRAQQ